MERFLERLAISKYRNTFILKGGTLVSAIVGLDNRSTMDVDATIIGFPLSIESAREIVEEITSIPLNDEMLFEIRNVTTIMDETDYSGVRVALDATLESMRTPLKMDFSTGNIITPREVEYSYQLLFEERTISILAYNLETVLAEKLETLITRGVANTSMRDFYDIYALETMQSENIDHNLLSLALMRTSGKRNSLELVYDASLILDEIEVSREMMALWKSYQKKFDYAADISWSDVMISVKRLYTIMMP
jgi:predicted nucleotidyltransferase component of viral defense system